MTYTNEVIARVHREEWARVVAILARRLRDLDIAEEMAAEAFAIAVERWPVDGVPPNPGAWLTTTAYRRAVDRLRREVRREEKHKEALVLSDPLSRSAPSTTTGSGSSSSAATRLSPCGDTARVGAVRLVRRLVTRVPPYRLPTHPPRLPSPGRAKRQRSGRQKTGT